MTSDVTDLTESEQSQRTALVERLFMATIASLELLHVYIGDRLGLYRALADGGASLTATELSRAAGIDERYAREWLEQQAVAGIIEVESADSDSHGRRYMLPAAHAEVLLESTSLNYLAPLASGVASLASTLPAVMEAFRKGGGVPFEAYGQDIRMSISGLNRPMFLNQLGSEWLPVMKDVDIRLRSEPPARVADLGCGTGWSSLAIAKAYPLVRVDGLDLDSASIAQARENAVASELVDRVTFQERNAADPGLAGQYDLVTAFETIHDMSDPVGALRAMRSLMAPAGAVLIADERVADEFTAPGDDLERFMYGWSALHCLPVGMVDPPAVGTGTVMRSATLRRYATEAGFKTVEVLPIEHDFWRFYRLFV